MIVRMPANRMVPLVAREGLRGPYWLLTFRHPEVAREARAGQFVMIKAGTSAEPPLRRPFSIMLTDAAAETFTLFIKDVGPGSGALCALDPGERSLAGADEQALGCRFPGGVLLRHRGREREQEAERPRHQNRSSGGRL